MVIITLSVQHHVSESRIEDFIKQQPFLKTVKKVVRAALDIDGEASETKLKSMDEDVDTLKKLFRTEIGATTWAVAARLNTSPKHFNGQAPGGGGCPGEHMKGLLSKPEMIPRSPMCGGTS